MATYYIDMAVGNDGNLGTSEGAGNAWQTIDKAMDNVGDGDLVYVKASASYTETATIDFQATWSSPVVFEGYTTTPGDGGKATIDGESTRASGIVENSLTGNTNYVFKNFIFTGHTSYAVDLNDVDRFTWKNCEFNSSAANGGAWVGVLHAFENCKFYNNTGDGVICQGGAVFIGCLFDSNTLSGIDASGAAYAIYCVFHSNGSHAMDSGAANDVVTLMIHCTVDGDGKDTDTGLYQNPAFRHFGAVVNCIFYDATTGVDFSNEEAFISRNNLVNSNTTDYNNGAATHEGEVTSAPQFLTEGSDYRLGSGSPAIGAGYDHSTFIGETSGANIGAHASEKGGAGGAAGMKTGGRL